MASAALGSSPTNNAATPARTNATPITDTCQMDRLVVSCITASKMTLTPAKFGLTEFSANARPLPVSDEETGERSCPDRHTVAAEEMKFTDF
jgi:hypothetical protein